MQVDRFTMRKPADMHQHLRDGHMLDVVAPLVAERFAMAIVMPNTVPPITDAAALNAYRAGIGRATKKHSPFTPLMTAYLTDSITRGGVDVLMDAGAVGFKYYPRGLTTNSEHGVADPTSLWTKGTGPYETLSQLAIRKGVLLLHAADGVDKNGKELDPYDQETHFIKESLPRIREHHPNLKISVEHLSTEEGAKYIKKNGNERLGCSLTAHHLLLDRRDMLRGGFRPHAFWWPIIQREEDKLALRELAKAGHDFVWLGSDSAPHTADKKEAACCSGGVLMAHAGIELYVEAFEAMSALDKLENFASINGPRFFGKEPSTETITLVREPWIVKDLLIGTASGTGRVVPFRLGEEVRWKLLTN